MQRIVSGYMTYFIRRYRLGYLMSNGLPDSYRFRKQKAACTAIKHHRATGLITVVILFSGGIMMAGKFARQMFAA